VTDLTPKKKKKEEKAFSGRGYPIAEAGGRSFPSVTTIVDVVGKPALVPWAVKKERTFLIGVAADLWNTGAEFASREKYIEALAAALGQEGQHKKAMSEAADIGTVVHGAIERNLRAQLGLPVPAQKKIELSESQKDSARQAYAAYLDWKTLTKFHPVEIEKRLYSLTDEYAGTMDTLGEGNLYNPYIYADLVVGDWKTSAGIYLTACMQISAYRKAYIEMGLHTQPRPLGGLIVRLPKTEEDPDFEARFIPEADMETYFQHFLAAKALFWAVQEYERKFPWRAKKKATKKEAA